MADNTTNTIIINKINWMQISATGEQFLLTPPSKSKTYIIWYTFSTSRPGDSYCFPTHRYIQNESSEGFVSGSYATSACWSRLSPISEADSLDCSVTILGDST